MLYISTLYIYSVCIAHNIYMYIYSIDIVYIYIYI